MTWVRLDDAVMSHPKMLSLDPVSFAVWVGGLTYANRHATDGHVPDGALWGLIPGAWKVAPRFLTVAAQALVSASLWLKVDGGWSINGYGKYQEEALSENVTARRDATRERKRAQREREKHSVKPVGHAVTSRDSHAPVTRDSSESVASADPAPPTAQKQLADNSRRTLDELAANSGRTFEEKKSSVLQGKQGMSQGPVPSRPVPSNIEEKESAPPQLKSVGQDLIERTQATRALLEQGFRSRGLKVPPCLHDRVPYSKEAQAIAESVPLAELPTLIENFFANAWAAKRSFNVALIVDNPNEYTGTVNPRQVRANSEYRDRTAEETAALWNQGRTA